jgi:predicted DsbA family dithiol-disulfide isomerase
MAKFPSVEFDVKWLPFQLNANAPREGENKLRMYMQKFNRSKDQTMQMSQMMARNFADVNLPYQFTDKGLTGNTFNGHRLLAYAHAHKGAAVQDALMEELFLNYFGQEKFVNCPKVLIAAAVKAGIEQQEAERVVNDESVFAQETKDELAIGRSMRVSGVPFFVFERPGDKGLAVSGAQPTEAFVEVIGEVLPS